MTNQSHQPNQGYSGGGSCGAQQHQGYPQQSPQPPVGGAPPPYYAGGQAPQYPPMPPMGPPKKRRRWLRVGLPLVLVVALIGGTLVFFYAQAGGFRSAQEKDLGSGSATDPLKYGVDIAAGATKPFSADPQGYTPTASPDAGQLAAVDPRQFYFAMLKRQGAIHHDGVSRCVDGGQIAIYTTANPIAGITASWRSQPDDDKTCARRMQPTWDVANVGTSDGVMPGGLTSDEADKYLSYLDHVPGLIDVKKPAVVTGTDGKKYIQLDVNIVPQDAKIKAPDRQGVAFLEAGFAQTGHKPTDYPLIVGAGAAQGRHFLYYVDPQTVLPAYAVALDTKVTKLDGTIDADNQQNAGRTLYEYGYP